MEAVVNLVAGFIIAMFLYTFIINPLYDIHVTPVQNMGIVMIFNAASLLRQYILRRFFNGRSIYAVIMRRRNKTLDEPEILS